MLKCLLICIINLKSVCLISPIVHTLNTLVILKSAPMLIDSFKVILAKSVDCQSKNILHYIILQTVTN